MTPLKKAIVWLGLCLLLISGTPLWAGQNVIKVGLLAPITGPSPEWGKKQVVGMEMSIDKINKRGGVNGTPVAMVQYDSGGDGTITVAAYRRLAREDKVLAVIGPLFTDEFEALRPVTNEEKVAIVATASAKPGLSDLSKYPYAFRMTVTSEKKEGATAKAWVQAHDIKTVAILYDQKGSFTLSLGKKLWPRVYKNLGVKVVNFNDPIVFNTGDKDFTQQVRRLKAYNPDGIAIAAFPQEAGILIKEIRDQGMAQPIQGGSAVATPTVIDIAGKSAEGIYSNTLFNPYDPNPKVANYVKAFEARCLEKYPGMGCNSEQFDVVVYDILQFLVNIMKKERVAPDPNELVANRNKIRDGLADMRMWRGTAGMMAFDKKGDGIRTIHIMQVKDGKWQTVY